MKRATVVLTLWFIACAGAAPCPPKTAPAATETLYFGTARPGGVVTAAEFRAFVDEVITPRFPEGLTVAKASGQWRDAKGAIVAERSYVVEIILLERRDEAIEAIVSEYKSRFQQEAVLRVRTASCAGF